MAMLHGTPAEAADEPRTRPNILVTGTPGTGKTTTAKMIAAAAADAGAVLEHVEVGRVVESAECHEGRDDEFDAWILDEDKLCDELEDKMSAGGVVADFHSCDFFPERWFDLVLVLRTDNDVLYPRLEARGYAENKVNENITAEIMQTVLDEARDSYAAEVVVELPSNTITDMESNVSRVIQWLQAWRPEASYQAGA